MRRPQPGQFWIMLLILRPWGAAAFTARGATATLLRAATRSSSLDAASSGCRIPGSSVPSVVEGVTTTYFPATDEPRDDGAVSLLPAMVVRSPANPAHTWPHPIEYHNVFDRRPPLLCLNHLSQPAVDRHASAVGLHGGGEGTASCSCGVAGGAPSAPLPASGSEAGGPLPGRGPSGRAPTPRRGDEEGGQGSGELWDGDPVLRLDGAVSGGGRAAQRAAPQAAHLAWSGDGPGLAAVRRAEQRGGGGYDGLLGDGDSLSAMYASPPPPPRGYQIYMDITAN